MSNPSACVILVVEDHPLTLQMVVTMLSRAFPQHTVHGTESASAALASFHGLQPRVVVTDVRLPDGNGVELTKTMTASGSRTDVVIYSVEDSAVFREEALRAGARSFVSKRRPRDLVAIVEAILTDAPSGTPHKGGETT